MDGEFDGALYYLMRAAPRSGVLELQRRYAGVVNDFLRLLEALETRAS
jgi:hypothetical protein